MKRIIFSVGAVLFVGLGWVYYKNVIIYQKEKDFIVHGLIREGALYTLLGDKPVSDFGSFYECNDYELLTEDAVEKINSIDPEKVVRMKVNRSKLKFSKDCCYDKDLGALWEDWKSRYPISGKNFSLVIESVDNASFLYFINKPLVRKTIKDNYDLFVQSIGKEFDIDVVMKEIDDIKSLFWTHMMNADHGHICMGLLFGYGMNNTISFQEFCNKDEPVDIKNFSFNQPYEDLLNAWSMLEVSLEDLPLPIYRMFFDNDPVLEHYKQERARIQEEYKDVDLRKLFIKAFQN